MKKVIALSISIALIFSSTASANPKARIAPKMLEQERADDSSFTAGLTKLGKGVGGIAYCQGKTAGDFFKKEDKQRGDFVGIIGYPFAVALNVLGSARYIGSGLVETLSLGYISTGDSWVKSDGIRCPGNMWESNDKEKAHEPAPPKPLPVSAPIKSVPFKSSSLGTSS